MEFVAFVLVFFRAFIWSRDVSFVCSFSGGVVFVWLVNVDFVSVILCGGGCFEICFYCYLAVRLEGVDFVYLGIFGSFR